MDAIPVPRDGFFVLGLDGVAHKKIAGRKTGYQQDLCPKIPEITITIKLF
jgi:hypothetical protein